MASLALPELTPALNILISLPTLPLGRHLCSPHYSHMGLLAVPWMCHLCSHVKAAALAVPSTVSTWLTPSPPPPNEQYDAKNV